jgi:hypothetical protein
MFILHCGREITAVVSQVKYRGDFVSASWEFSCAYVGSEIQTQQYSQRLKITQKVSVPWITAIAMFNAIIILQAKWFVLCSEKDGVRFPCRHRQWTRIFSYRTQIIDKKISDNDQPDIEFHFSYFALYIEHDRAQEVFMVNI